MDRIYWIGTGLELEQFVPVKHKRRRLRDFDPDEESEIERRAMRPIAELGQRPEFQHAQDWLWGKGKCSKAFEATEDGMKSLLNALCYNKGKKEVLAFSRKDLEESS